MRAENYSALTTIAANGCKANLPCSSIGVHDVGDPRRDGPRPRPGKSLRDPTGVGIYVSYHKV